MVACVIPHEFHGINTEVTVTLMRQGHPDYQEMTLEVLPEG